MYHKCLHCTPFVRRIQRIEDSSGCPLCLDFKYTSTPPSSLLLPDSTNPLSSHYQGMPQEYHCWMLRALSNNSLYVVAQDCSIIIHDEIAPVFLQTVRPQRTFSLCRTLYAMARDHQMRTSAWSGGLIMTCLAHTSNTCSATS